MTWSAVGVSHGGSGGTLSLSNQAAGNVLIAVVVNFSNNTVWCTGFTGGGATWVPAGAHFAGTTNAATTAAFLGTVTATGAQTATPTWSGTAPGNFQFAAFEFHSTVGSWVFDTKGDLDSSGTPNMPSLTPAHGAGELYFGFCEATGAMPAGSTSGYVYNINVDSLGNGSAYNLSCPATATFPAWNAADALVMGTAVLVAEAQPGGGPFNVTTTPTVIQSAPASASAAMRGQMTLTSLSGSIYLGGGTAVTSSTGAQVAPGNVPLTVPLFGGDSIYAVASGGTVTASILPGGM